MTPAIPLSRNRTCVCGLAPLNPEDTPNDDTKRNRRQRLASKTDRRHANRPGRHTVRREADNSRLLLGSRRPTVIRRGARSHSGVASFGIARNRQSAVSKFEYRSSVIRGHILSSWYRKSNDGLSYKSITLLAKWRTRKSTLAQVIARAFIRCAQEMPQTHGARRGGKKPCAPLAPTVKSNVNIGATVSLFRESLGRAIPGAERHLAPGVSTYRAPTVLRDSGWRVMRREFQYPVSLPAGSRASLMMGRHNCAGAFGLRRLFAAHRVRSCAGLCSRAWPASNAVRRVAPHHSIDAFTSLIAPRWLRLPGQFFGGVG